IVAVRHADPDGGLERSALPPLPALPSDVAVRVRGDQAVVTFAPAAGARDYRIYVEPDPADVRVAEDGSLTIAGALYRCAGDRPLPEVDAPSLGGEVLFYRRDPADAVLGHVYLTPGPGRAPVYALGDPVRDEIYEDHYFRNS